MQFKNVPLRRQPSDSNRPAASTAAVANETHLDNLYIGNIHCARLKAAVDDPFDPGQHAYDLDLVSTMIPSHVYPLDSLSLRVRLETEVAGDGVKTRYYTHKGIEDGPLLSFNDANMERGALLLAESLRKVPPSQMQQRFDAPHYCRATAADNATVVENDEDEAGKPRKCYPVGRGSASRGNGGNGGVCTRPKKRLSALSIKGDVNTPTDYVPYTAVVWHWLKEYPLPNEPLVNGLDAEGRLHYELMSRFRRGYVKMVMTIIPNGDVVWVPIREEDAEDIDCRLKDAYIYHGNAFPVYTLQPPTYLDGPDIWIAHCDFL